MVMMSPVHILSGGGDGVEGESLCQVVVGGWLVLKCLPVDLKALHLFNPSVPSKVGDEEL